MRSITITYLDDANPPQPFTPATPVDQQRVSAIEVTIVGLYRMNRCNESRLWEVCGSAQAIVTVEEHGRTGGIGSLVGRLLSERGHAIPFRGLSLGDEMVFGSASRIWAYGQCGLEKESLKNTFRHMALLPTTA